MVCDENVRLPIPPSDRAPKGCPTELYVALLYVYRTANDYYGVPFTLRASARLVCLTSPCPVALKLQHFIGKPLQYIERAADNLSYAYAVAGTT